MTPPLSDRRLVPPAEQPVPTGMRLLLGFATAILTALVILPWIVPFGPLQGDAWGTFAATVVIAAPGALLAIAARRANLDSRLRGALVLLAMSMGLAVAGNLLRLVGALGAHLPNIPIVSIGSNVLVWACGIAALLMIPLAPVGRGAAWQIGTDAVIAVGGLALAIFAVWTLPGFSRAPHAARVELLAYNAMEAANLVVLNLILVRGPRRPLRRAIWCLAGTIIVETTYLVAMQYALGRQNGDFRLANSLFFVDYYIYLFAGVFFLTDVQPDTDVPLLPENVRAFNPLPMAAILGVSVLLILSTRRPSDPALFPLALGLSILALLLLARVVMATTEVLRLAREEAAIHQREQLERLQVMGRLAGGIAHVINNLMAVVLGHASLIVDAAGSDQDLRASGEAIGQSARHASALAERLRYVSGYRKPDPRRSPLVELVRLQREQVEMSIGQTRVVTWDLPEIGGGALIAPAAVDAIVKELIANAVDATAVGGQITIRVYDESRATNDTSMILVPPPGRCSVLSVEDTGCGIAPGIVSRVCEPYFTTRPLVEGRGLGLSVVFGVVAGLSGGLRIESHVGSGTRVSVCFPASSDDGPKFEPREA